MGRNCSTKRKGRFPFFWLTLIVLLLGISAILLNTNNKSKAVEITGTKTATEKFDSIDKKQNSLAEPLRKADNKDDAVTNNSSKTASNTNIHNNAITLPLVSKDKIIPITNIVYSTAPSDNKKRRTGNQKTNTENSEKLFASHKNKRTTNASTKVKIMSGGLDSIINVVENKEKKLALNNDQYNSNDSKQVKRKEVETGNPLVEKTENNYDETVQDKIPILPIMPSSDTLNTKKIVLVADTLKIKDEIAIYALKKPTNNIRKYRLKIEAGIEAVSPTQNYTPPLYVTRVLDDSSSHAEFVSDKIKTTVEPGIGFSISLVKQLHEKWSIGAGMQWLRITEHLQISGIETNTNYTIVQRLVTDPAGNFWKTDTVSAISKSNSTLNGRNVYHSLGIPLFVRYQVFDNKKWSAEITGGVYIDLLREYHNSTPGKFETTYGTASGSKNTMGIDVFAGLQIQRRLSSKYALFASPSFRYNLSSYKINILSFNKKIHKPTVSIGISRYL